MSKSRIAWVQLATGVVWKSTVSLSVVSTEDPDLGVGLRSWITEESVGRLLILA